MKITHCLVVDDEPIARDIVEDYIGRVPFLKLVASCSDAFEAMDVLRNGKVDVVLLDINMPRLSGMDMLRTLKTNPQVIITSAYAEYALEGFELSVCDYLLKPFSFERFLQAIEKAIVRSAAQPEKLSTSAGTEALLFVKSDKRLVKVDPGEIRYIESIGNYITIYSGSGKAITKQTLTRFEEQLPPGKFIKIHKSYVVALKSIEYLEGNRIWIGDRFLPVGKVFRENLEAWLK